MRIEWFFIWTNLNPLASKDALCQVWLKLAQWFWRRRLFNFVNIFCYFVIISPWKRAGPFIWPKDALIVPSLVEIGPVVLEKKMKMRKVYYNDTNDDEDNDNDDGQRTNYDQKSSLEPSAQVN